jgi:alpha-amylase
MKNPTLLQCFHWYYPTGGELWREVEALAPNLNEIGINMIWLPPAYKGASGGYSVGYDCYDLFDLGEFDQKGSVATKYGDKTQLLAAIAALRQHDIAVLLDVVVNHKMGADEKEPVRIQRVDQNDRTQIADEIVECEAWTRYTFPVRPANTLNSSGIISASAASIISRIPTKMACLKSSTTIPARDGTIRSMMKWVTSTT